MRKDTQVRHGDTTEQSDSLEVLDADPRAELPEPLPAPASRDGLRTQEPLGPPLGIREAASLIGCSTWTIRQRYLFEGLPYFQSGRGGKLIFYRNQVVRWLLERQQKGGLVK